MPLTTPPAPPALAVPRPRAVGVVLRGVGAAVVAGVVTGLLARLLMRLVTVAADGTGAFSWGGTASIVVVFVVAALPGALLAAATGRRYRWVLLAAGAAFLLLPATGVAAEEVGGTHGFSAGQWAGVLAAGAGVYACIAALPLLVLRLLDRGR